MKSIYCIGEILIDFVAEKQGNDLTKAVHFTKKAGGAPANVAAAIAKLGGKSDLIGCVGNDPFGEFLLQTMISHKVGVAFAQQSASTFTTLAFVSLAKDGERDFVFNRGADKELRYDEKLTASFKDQIVHFGAATAFLGGNLQEAYKRYLLDAHSQNAFICFDPNFRADLWKNNEQTFIKSCRPFIEKADLTKFSLEEAQLISGKETIENACEIIHQIGAKIVCITLGKNGTYISAKNIKEQINSISVQPKDTTGAGDAFIGCLLKQIATQKIPKSILEDKKLLLSMTKKANKAGAITATQYGAIAALPTEQQLNEF